MRLGGRRAGNSTIFMDSVCEEVLLRIDTDSNGSAAVAFRLYDCSGNLVADDPEAKCYPDGLCVRSANNELLLQIPASISETIAYCLYNSQGRLLTMSDGVRTQIFGGLRMAGKS